MITVEKIREDLKEIRHYYSKQKEFEQVGKSIGDSKIIDKINIYNEAIRNAPIKLYDVYAALYIHNNTQEALAYDWDCSPHTIFRLSKRLLEYLHRALN